MALGAVPAGSMKPQLAAIAVGIASSSGSAPVAIINPATTGMKPDAEATLLANSVTRMMKAVSTSAITTSGTSFSIVRRSPSQTANPRSEEHTSEIQSLMRISYAVFFLKKKKINKVQQKNT